MTPSGAAFFGVEYSELIGNASLTFDVKNRENADGHSPQGPPD